MPLSQKEAIRRLWQFGHFANPANPDTHNVTEADLGKLKFKDAVVRQAVASIQDFMAVTLEPLSMEEHARPAIHDGDVGPATLRLLEVQRCAVPDYNPELPAVGSGNWQRCHDVGNFHRATVYINRASMPAWLKPLFDRVFANVQRAYREVGLDWVITEDAQRHNTSWTWVRPDGGWIGLAIVGRNLDCASKIWARYDQNYEGGSSEASIINQVSSLCQHEAGHNVGLEHSRGGVMNPSIINGLPIGTWQNDPSLPTLKQWYGGEPFVPDTPEPGPGPGPGPGPKPPAGSAPTFRATVTVPENCPPGRYELISVPRPEV